MKLELKHLAPYLPYGLKMINVNQRVLSGIKTDCHILTLDGIRRNGISFEGFGGFYEVNDYYVFKPILRPLSDLTKDEYDFVYKDETDYESISEWLKLDTESRFCSKFSYYFWVELFHYHFDVFALIEKGLAIDINTLK